MPLESFNQLLGLATVLLQIATAILLAIFVLRHKVPDLDSQARWVGTHAFYFALTFSVVASSITLIHSELYGIPPCIFCIWQRVFLYPQIFLFAFAIYKKVDVTLYSIGLSLVGLCIAVYHHALQMFPSGALPCPSVGVSCAQIFFLELGYITYPMMAASLFVFLIVLMLFARSASVKNV